MIEQENMNIHWKDNENIKKLESQNKIHSLKDEEYILVIGLKDNYFKIIQKSPMASSPYIEQYDLETIKIFSFIIKDNVIAIHKKVKFFQEKEVYNLKKIIIQLKQGNYQLKK